MVVLFNLLPIKKGGGQQVATNFVRQTILRKDLHPIYVVTRDTLLHKFLLEVGVDRKQIVIIENSLLLRIRFTFFDVGKIIRDKRIELIYTMFGPGLHHKDVKSVTGCAYSNLFFPEIDFWEGYSFLQRIKLRLIDKYRLKTTLKSDAIVFENEAMLKRAVSLLNYPVKKTKLILPSISEVSEKSPSTEFKKRLEIINRSDYNILLLTGWHKNKNIEIIPEVLECLFKKKALNVTFIITVPSNHSKSIELLAKAKRLNVANNIIFFDTVTPFEVPHLIEIVNAMALFSKLESFSNNIIEAWTYKKALFISNEEWSKAICKEFAIYVDRNDANDISNKIIEFKNNSGEEEKLINSYDQILQIYPSSKQKVDLQIEFLKKVYNEKSN